jgi:diadenylate cyclase
MYRLLLLERNLTPPGSLLTYLRGQEKILFHASDAPSEALEEVRKGNYEVILTHHPGGIRFLTSLRGEGIHIPFIFYGDRYDAIEELQALQEGADYYLWDDPSHLSALDSVIRNLAARWNEEEQARQENLIMKTVLDASPLALAVVKDHRMIWMNDRMPRKLGYQKHELLGTDPLQLIPGEEEHRRIDEGLFSHISPRGWGTVETEIHRKDGSPLSCRLRSRPINPADPSQGHIIIGQDISDYTHIKDLLRKSEMRYQTLLDQANSIVLRVDATGKIKFINKFGEQFFGYTAKELVGKNLVGTVLSARSRSGRDLAAMVVDLMRNPEEYEINVNENMKKNGERVWIAWTNKAIRDEQGNLLEMVSIGNDITDRMIDERNSHIRAAPWKTAVLVDTDIKEEVFEAAYSISVELSREGREGKPIGTAFMLGDAQTVLEKSRQLILNPFEGHPASARSLTNPDLKETIKELAQLDGAFVVSGDGVVEAAGRYITIDTSQATVPKGLGTRHASVAGITQETKAVGIVVSQSGGRISIFKDGRIVRIITLNE